MVLFSLGYSSMASAATLETGIRLFQRLSGVPPTSGELSQIEDLAAANNLKGIAELATNTRGFINTTVKAWAAPMSNVSAQASVEFNDFTATIVGLVRDEAPLDQMMWDDVTYVGNRANLLAVVGNPISVPQPAYYRNDHWRQLELKGVDLNDPSLFERALQSSLSDARGAALLPEQTMGVMTSHASAEAFLQAGTNRRMVRFMLIDFMCVDMEQLHDTTLSDFMVRRDVPRNAGGDSRTYINTCAGCHAGMDPLANAFNLYDTFTVVGGMQEPLGIMVKYDSAKVQNIPGLPQNKAETMVEQANKVTRNYQNYPEGFRPRQQDGNIERWVNQWTVGQNSFLGFRTPAKQVGEPDSDVPNINMGNGIKSLGRVFGATTQFSRCMAQRAYSSVCNRKAPYSQKEIGLFANLAESFDNQGRSGKALFVDSAVACIENEMGE